MQDNHIFAHHSPNALAYRLLGNAQKISISNFCFISPINFDAVFQTHAHTHTCICHCHIISAVLTLGISNFSFFFGFPAVISFTFSPTNMINHHDRIGPQFIEYRFCMSEKTKKKERKNCSHEHHEYVTPNLITQQTNTH